MYIFLIILLNAITVNAEIKIWEIQKANDPFNPQTWKSLDKQGKIEYGIVIENKTLSLLMLRNASEIRIWDKHLGPQRSLSLSVLNTATSAVKSVSMSLENIDKQKLVSRFQMA